MVQRKKFIGFFDIEKPLLCAYNCEKAEKKNIRLFLWGDIYNTCEIMEIVGENYKSNADLLLLLFIKRNINGFKLVDGSFTVIIITVKKIYIIRDRNGINLPVYYTNKKFSSSLKELLNIPYSSYKLDENAICSFFYGGYIPAPYTPLEDIKKLSAGSVLIYEYNKSLTKRHLFGFNDYIREKCNYIDERTATEKYESLLIRSVHKRIYSNNTIGVLLSGGYDSVGNLAILREIYNGHIKSFSIGFKDSIWSEHLYARLVAERFNTEHNEYLLDGSEIEYLPFIIKFLEEPFAEAGLIINFMAMNMISNKIDVVLGGDGNDQMFGAGGKYLVFKYMLKKSRLSRIQDFFNYVSRNDIFYNDNFSYRLKFYNQRVKNILGRTNLGFDEYEIERITGIKWNEEKLEIIPKIEKNQFNNYDSFYKWHNFFISIGQDNNEVILKKASRLADMNCVNLVFPYTDLNIYNFLKKLPSSLKMKINTSSLLKWKITNKYLHKLLFRSKLPEVITERKKQGGFVPLEIFFKGKERRKKIYKYILNSSAVRYMLKEDKIREFFLKFENSITKKNNWFWYRQWTANRMLNLLVFALWWDIFINGDERKKLSDYYNC